jgi:putative Mn2+ efflux pump MntP
MEDYQTALYGFFVIIAVGLIQFMINQFMNKKASLEKEKIDNILSKITEIGNKLDALMTSLNKHDTEIEVIKEKIAFIMDKLRHLEK